MPEFMPDRSGRRNHPTTWTYSRGPRGAKTRTGEGRAIPPLTMKLSRMGHRQFLVGLGLKSLGGPPALVGLDPY